MATVMIVDDSAFMRILLKDLIQAAGYQVAAEAENGFVAVEAYTRTRPEVVLMNIVMPEMNGIEALKRIKNIDQRARVIMCSAMGNSYNVVESIQAGAVDFIVKPFEQGRIEESLKRALARL